MLKLLNMLLNKVTVLKVILVHSSIGVNILHETKCKKSSKSTSLMARKFILKSQNKFYFHCVS